MAVEISGRRWRGSSRGSGARTIREDEPVRSITADDNSRIENSSGFPMFTGPVTSFEALATGDRTASTLAAKLLVGGPNPQFSIDACCRAPAGSPAYRCYGATAFSLCQRNFTPPLAQPPAKSYLQYNDSWPANSWEITEPSLSYQSYYVRLLAAFTR